MPVSTNKYASNLLSTPFLSIIIPAHNEEHRLPHTLEHVKAFLQTQPYSAEILVVENASQDRTHQIALEFAKTHFTDQPLIRVLQVQERGKGVAVKRGMLEARGEYRFMCDADW